MKTKSKSRKTYDQLISGFYGTSNKSARNKKKSNFVISKSFDNGEILAQKSRNNFFEYVVQSSVVTPVEEYIVSKQSSSTLSRQSSVDMATLYSPTQRYTVAQETQTNLDNPLQDDAGKLAMLDRFNDSYTSTDNAPVTPTIINTPSTNNTNQINNESDNKNAAYNNHGVQLSIDDVYNDKGKPVSTDDDFVRDMQAILTGQKVFDPINKKTVDKSFAASQTPSENIQLPQIENKHAIFDQIAQSMEYAKAYDLGSIDIDKRFNDFDKILDIEKNIAVEKKSPIKNVAVSASKPDVSAVGNEEFIRDLDRISKAASAGKESNPAASVCNHDQLSGQPTTVVQKEQEVIAQVPVTASPITIGAPEQTVTSSPVLS
ncbi:MAG: hypothetical protein H0W84_09960 [Bacteroidetes bacterium]|nr:hypothetical protein [Bacteroidota bacterium]